MQDGELKNAGVFWKFGVFLFALLIAADLLSKHFAKNIFRNYVFAFSIPLPEPLTYLVYAIVLAVMVYYLRKNYRLLSFLQKSAWLLIFTGAILNIGERIFLGYVRDFIYITFYKWTGIYNFADWYIIAGIIILLRAHNNDKNEQKLKK